jgi:hypothetical protein
LRIFAQAIRDRSDAPRRFFDDIAEESAMKFLFDWLDAMLVS